MSDETITNEQGTIEPDESQLSPREATFAEIEPSEGGEADPQSMDFLLDIPLDISVELGRTKIQIGELLKLSQGSVVELEKLVNQPLDIYVNQKLMAQGEVVVVNEKFGVRLTHIISPGERVKNLS